MAWMTGKAWVHVVRHDISRHWRRREGRGGEGRGEEGRVGEGRGREQYFEPCLVKNMFVETSKQYIRH